MPKTDTRLKMIKAAIDLFHLHGVNATSVDQILAKSDTGKSQFSHYFRNKDGLVHAALTFLHEIIQAGKAGTGYEVKTWKDMDRWLQTYIDFQKSVDFARSCPIGTIGNDIANGQDLLRQDAINFLEWSRGQLALFFRQRKLAGELAPHAQPERLADFFISIMQGGMLLTKIKRDPDMFENAAREARAYLKTLRVRNRGAAEAG